MFANRYLIKNFLKPVFIRKYAAQPNYIIQLENKVLDDIKNEQYKPRKHPGVIKKETVAVPDHIISAIKNTVVDFPQKTIIDGSTQLLNYLKHRLVPIETPELRKKQKSIEKEILSEHGTENMTADEKLELFTKHRKKMIKKLNSKVHSYIWKPIEYDELTALKYFYARAAQDYAVLYRIFKELKIRDPDFKPRSFFDFGSGIGTGTWTVNLFWGNSLYEYFCVDASPAMNDLADTLLKDGTPTKNSCIKGVFYRQFLPSTNRNYDIVLCAYTLLDLPTRKHRLEAILNLWNKTQTYLVIVELGTNAGFKVVNEARDFVLNIKDENNEGHVTMPCPHDHLCPRLVEDDTPCNFQINYISLPFTSKDSEIRKEQFTYVVLKKGKRDPNDPQWPRLVRNTAIRSRHAVCRVCLSNGKLESLVISQSKHGKITYRCARGSNWGDFLPMNITPNDESDMEQSTE